MAAGLHLCYWLLRPTGESPPHRADSTLAIATVVLAAVASVLLLIAARAASAIAGCALGLLLSANLGHLLSSFDEPDEHLRQLVRYGGWLSIPITLLALTSLLLLAVPAKAARPTGADQ
ncbi:hypothetical protein VMT65_14210 [Nocardia sp. CDC153]|uniref:hypothetical protein n=1 Tax=Nocardia sp. CDC153 TaxID=3112167 RepID=UPI002DBE7713|nr:hypothetical protein [Nocardia sp. CDC153]MEC3954189.1 hypothetical protein [Nocardia sp. CDC153]